ncbi:TonB-dependent receptor domain-containing protein [Hymenobacter koreensis]|uniref:Outer membrane beta-barrel family protein n=1 Tax=Hymenobacter koreensis TaxID=1084523 RepID=A0ABP8JHD0_9BACT
MRLFYPLLLLRLRATVLLFFVLSTAVAQTLPISKGTGRLTGTVVHATTGKAVEYANVGLLETASGKLINGGSCDEKGQFVLGNIGAGSYKLNVSFVGYQPKTVEGVVFATADASVTLGNIALTPIAQQLGEVKVVGERELIENKVDRIVYNADKDISNAGGTASDVLQKVPLLSVDLNGNLQLRGSGNIRVLVNNKPSTILANNLADALRQIPADQIKSVEVITSPSAKYDAEGTAGIVNINLKKNSLEGMNGSVNAAGGNRGGFLNGSLNSKRGKVGLNTNVGTNVFYNVARSQSDRTEFLSDTTQSQLGQSGDFTNLGGGAFAQVGLDYDLTPKDVFNLSARGNLFGYTNDRFQGTSYQIFRPQNTGERLLFQDVFGRDIITKQRDNNLDLNFGYTRTLPKPRQELSVLALYSINQGNTDYTLTQRRAEVRDYLENSFNDSRNQELTFQTDYVHPLDSTTTLETGLKSILRRVDSNYLIEADSLDGRGFVPVPARSNAFRYDQFVYAGYASYGFSVGKSLTFKAGSRLEHTRINGDFRTEGVSLQTDFTNLAPNLQAAWDVNKDHKLKLSYTRRVQRPSIFYLNPYINLSDRRNISSGNPRIDPELTDAYELGYNTFIKKSSVTFSAYWRQTNNAIESISRLVPSNELLPTTDTTRVLYTTYQNLARNSTYGLSAFGSTKLTPKWNLSGNVNFYYRQVSSAALGLTNGGGMFNMNLNSQWTFDKGWSAQFNGFFNSRRIELQGRSSGYRTYNLAVKKELFDKKASITASVINPFNRTLVFRNNLASERFDYQNNSYFYNRQFRVSFNYRFGKLDAGPARPKKSIRNDDQKSGDGGNG